jgi:hypothetical protein
MPAGLIMRRCGRVGPHQMPTAFAARSFMQDRKYSVTRQTMLHVYSAGH